MYKPKKQHLLKNYLIYNDTLEKIKVIKRTVVQRGKTNEIKFCGYCGKEITRFDYKTGQLLQVKHAVLDLETGIKITRCLQTTCCQERRLNLNGKD